MRAVLLHGFKQGGDPHPSPLPQGEGALVLSNVRFAWIGDLIARNEGHAGGVGFIEILAFAGPGDVVRTVDD